MSYCRSQKTPIVFFPLGLQQKYTKIPSYIPEVKQLAPEKLPSQKESSLLTIIIFQGLCHVKLPGSSFGKKTHWIC